MQHYVTLVSWSDLAASGALDGDLEQLHLKLLSLLDNPAVVVAAAAHGDASTIKDYLSKHLRDVCSYIMLQQEYTIGRILIVWFNDCIVGKSGQITNPIITMATPYHIIVYMHVYVCESINCEHRKYSQFAINRYSQLKLDLWY